MFKDKLNRYWANSASAVAREKAEAVRAIPESEWYRVRCLACGYEGKVPPNMTAFRWAKWHNWLTPLGKAGEVFTSPACSQCHARVG